MLFARSIALTVSLPMVRARARATNGPIGQVSSLVGDLHEEIAALERVNEDPRWEGIGRVPVVVNKVERLVTGDLWPLFVDDDETGGGCQCPRAASPKPVLAEPSPST